MQFSFRRLRCRWFCVPSFALSRRLLSMLGAWDLSLGEYIVANERSEGVLPVVSIVPILPLFDVVKSLRVYFSSVFCRWSSHSADNAGTALFSKPSVDEVLSLLKFLT